MRIPLDKFLTDTTFIDTEAVSGFVNSEHTVMIVPRTDEAIMHCIIEHGLAFDRKKNDTLDNYTLEPLGSVNVNHLRLFVNSKENIAIGNSIYASRFLRIFTKHYKRKVDVFSILGNHEPNSPIRIASPCMDWWMFIAPKTTEDNRTVARMDLNPFTEGEFSQ